MKEGHLTKTNQAYLSDRLLVFLWLFVAMVKVTSTVCFLKKLRHGLRILKCLA